MKKFFLILFLNLFFSISALAVYDQNMLAAVTKFVDEKSFVAESAQTGWHVGEVVAVISQNPRVGATAFVEVESVKPKVNSDGVEIKMSLVRQSRKFFIQQGDFIKRLDLSAANTDYVGTTDLLIRDSEQSISSKYRPLVHQGFVIGDTAQTLYPYRVR